MLLVVLLLLSQDPTDQLRRQELALRLMDLANEEKFDGFARAVQRELRGPRVDAALLDQCWRPILHRRGDRLDVVIAAWDKAAAEPTPGRLLYRAKLEDLASRPKGYRDRLEDAVKTFPADPVLLWHAALVRIEAKDYGPAAAALETMASQKGAAFDVDEFHRLMATCYAELDRAPAAIEHLRAVKHEDENAADLAKLAAKLRLHGEAARLYAIALAEDPERTTLLLGYVVALNAAGDHPNAAAERTKLFQQDGRLSTSKIQDYFFLLSPEGRAEEIVRTMRDLRDVPPAALLKVVPPESRSSVLAVWERTARDGRDWVQLAQMKQSWTKEGAAGALAKAEELYPDDPWIALEKIRLQPAKGAAEAYARLIELDPGGRITGPRPYKALQLAVSELGVRDPELALATTLRLLSEPGADEATSRATRAALRAGWKASAADYWKELRKLKIPPSTQADVDRVRAQVARLSADDFDERVAATAELKKGGIASIPVLVQHVDDPDAEVRSRVRDAIRSILTD